MTVDIRVCREVVVEHLDERPDLLAIAEPAGEVRQRTI